MSIARQIRSISFERAFKIVVMAGALITAASFVAIAMMLAPGRPVQVPEGTAVRWTANAVPVSEQIRERHAARRESDRPEAPALPSLVTPAQAEPAPVPPAPAEAASVIEAATAVAEPDAVESGIAQEPARPLVLSRAQALDGGTLWADGRTIRLAGLTPLGLDALCDRGRHRGLWRCGERARATLQALVSRGRVTCTPVGGDAEAVLARCSVAGKDLSTALLARRLALPLAQTTAQNDRAYDPPPFYPTGRR